MKMACPDVTQWDLFLTEQLPSDAEDLFDDHLQHCEVCQARLEHITHPVTIQHVAEYLESFPKRSLLTSRLQRVVLDSVQPDDQIDEEATPSLPNIPGYVVHEMIGHGGSSIVYRASDTQLQRTVAIKLLREQSTPLQRQRFFREARSLASLHHLNVARIIEAGETAQHTFLVLEYIAGGSLAAYLAGTPQDGPQAARLVLQLATAAQKAHDTGFIHRDLKPGNILLDPHFGAPETNGLDRYVPKIIDFGIVKDLQATEDFTQTRDIVGTPSYMAPEQITHSKMPIDPRTDVYALGIILYELLTGRPPFRAASPIDTMLLIKHEEPVPPARFGPKLPRDLENICLKCIEKDPARRYASAQLLADDLGRYLQGQPVQARPISSPARLWRWSCRNPGWALATVLGLLILFTLAIIGPLLAHRERVLREEAAYEKNRAQEHLDKAGQVLDEMLDRLLNNLRLQDSAFDDIQKGLVTFAMPYLEEFVKEVDSAETLRLRQARSLLQLAMVQTKNKEIDKAQATYERSLSMLQALVPSDKLSGDVIQRTLGSAHMEYGRFVNIHRDDLPASERHYRKSLEITKALDQGLITVKNLDKYSILYSLLGEVLTRLPGRQQEGYEFMVKAAEHRDQLLQHYPQRDDLRHYAAMAHLNLAIYHRKQKQRQLEVDQFRRALDFEKQVNQSKSIWIESPYFVSTLQGELGLSLESVGHHEEALTHFRQAKLTADALTAVYPAVEKYAALARQWHAVLKHYDK